MKIAVVRNRNNDGFINRFGVPCPETYGRKTIQRVLDALRKLGHQTACLEADKTLLTELEKFLPPAENLQPTGLVFNMAYGLQGECRYTHVPAMLEMAGVPYTGSSPLGHALALDKVVTKILMTNAGVPTPGYRVFSRPDQDPAGLRFPVIVKPRHESTSYGLRLVPHPGELAPAVEQVLTGYRQDALLEEYVEGREVCVSLLGNSPPECLPIVELDFGSRGVSLMTWEDKFHKRADEPKKVCPAKLSAPLATRLREISVATFNACHCLDYSRVDIRIDSAGNPWVLEINSMASLGAGGSFVYSARAAGLSFTDLVGRIVDLAHQRYFGIPTPISQPAGHATSQTVQPSPVAVAPASRG